MALSLHNIFFGPRTEAPGVSPAQRRADTAQPFPLRETTPAAPVTRRSAPAVQVRLSKEALAFLGGDKSVFEGKDARPTAPPPQKAAGGTVQTAAFELEEFGPPPPPGFAAAPYPAQDRAPDRILPPGSTLDIAI